MLGRGRCPRSSATIRYWKKYAAAAALTDYAVLTPEHVAVRLLDGQAHDVDSSERSFKIAASMAIKDAARQADAHPMM